jgi:serine/threonine protein phosphatase PrpC
VIGLRFEIYNYSNRGARPNNEDSCGYWQGEARGKGAYVVADGLGGHDCGEVASRLAVEYILNAAQDKDDFSEEALLKMLDGANMRIIERQKANPEHKNIRTTIAAGFLDGDVFRHFHVGDSRFYYFKNGSLYWQSRDHSVSQMSVDMGHIAPEAIRFDDDRSKLLKVLGDAERLNINQLPSSIKIEGHDAFLLCTDGFWEYVFETEMELDLVKSGSPREWCEFMCKRLLRRVTGNNDNFTALCAFVA